MQTKILGCLSGWLLVGTLAWGQAPGTPPLAAPAQSPAPTALPAAPGPAGVPPSESAAPVAPLASDPEMLPGSPLPPSGRIDIDSKQKVAPCYWVGGEALIWWIRPGPLPIALLTSNPDPTARPSQANPTTQVLFGNGSNRGLDYGAIPGGRGTIGGWVDPDHVLALEGSFFALATQTINYTASSPGDGTGPAVGVPFNAVAPLFGTTTPFGETAFPAPFVPGGPIFSSTFQVSSSSRLFGGEANALYTIYLDDFHYWNLVVGFRTLALQESLTLSGTVVDSTDGVTASFQDHFSTKNMFYGGQIGTRGGVALGRFLLEGAFKLALGSTQQSLSITGSTNVSGNTVAGFPAPGTYIGGLFAERSNIGSYHGSAFTAIPEFQFQTSYTLNMHTSLVFGWNFLYMSSTLRPGNQIDRTIDPNQSVLLGGMFSPGIAGPYAPLVPFRRSDFWATGLNLGLEFRF